MFRNAKTSAHTERTVRAEPAICRSSKKESAPPVVCPLIVLKERLSLSLRLAHLIVLFLVTVSVNMLLSRIAGRAAVLSRSAWSAKWGTTGLRAMSSGHEVDIMDKKLYPPGYHPATYDEHIIPSGSWHENNEKLQKKYNVQLILSAGFFFFTVYYLSVCPEVDFVRAPKTLGVNPPKFSAVPKD